MEHNRIAKYPLYHLQPKFRITSLCTAGEAVRAPGYASLGEMHNFSECLFILDGIGEITAGETVYRLSRGQMIFHPPMEFHRVRNDSNAPLHILIFSFEADPCEIKDHRILAFPDMVRIRDLVENLRSLFVMEKIRLLEPLPDVTPYALQKAVSRLENYLISLFEQKEDFPVSPEDKVSELYSCAVTVMYQNLTSRLSANEIAALCGMSVSSMQKLFLKYAGIGMIKYYNNLRMHRARRLLEDGRSVKEVAVSLGYDDQNYFSTAYKRHFGSPPSQAKENV